MASISRTMITDGADSPEQIAAAAARDGRFVAREAQIPVDDIQLTGDLTIPSSPVGLVIFSDVTAGSRSSPRNTLLASRFNAAGIATLVINLLTGAEERKDAGTGYWRYDIELLVHRLGRGAGMAHPAPPCKTLGPRASRRGKGGAG